MWDFGIVYCQLRRVFGHYRIRIVYWHLGRVYGHFEIVYGHLGLVYDLLSKYFALKPGFAQNIQYRLPVLIY